MTVAERAEALQLAAAADAVLGRLLLRLRSGGRMDTATIRRYLDLKRHLAAVQRELDRLSPIVVHEVNRAGGRVVLDTYAIISQISRTWSFSEEVQLLEKILREKRRGEIESGKATLKSEKPFVMVRMIAEGSSQSPAVHAAVRQEPRHPTPAYIARIRQSHPRAYEAWTPDEDTALTWQFQQGRTLDEIAQAFRRQPGGVRSRLRKLGLTD